MALAPNLDALKKTVQPKQQGEPMKKNEEVAAAIEMSDADFAPNGIVSHAVYGLGGLGKVAACRYAKAGVDKNVKVITIDTSGVPQKLDSVESICIEGLSGSGKLRKENIDAIRGFATDFVADRTFDDVTVLVFSAAGGSGSVLGPVILAEILRQEKIAIVVSVIDTDSEVDTVNSSNTLKTLDNLAKSKEGYVPCVFFDNNRGRFKVDAGIDGTLRTITEMLIEPLIGLDTQDRLRFLKPTQFDGVTNGLKMLNLSRLDNGEWEDNSQIIPEKSNDRTDAILIISQLQDNVTITERCIVTFRGYRDDDKDNIIASIGYPVPEALIKLLNATIHAHKSMTPTKQTVIKSEYEIGKDHGGGMIL